MNTVRLEPELKEKIQQLAQIQGISQSELHRRALELYCQQNTVNESRFEDIFGIAEGESDLSERTGEAFAELMNKKHV
jgi:predicted transcriptional regulator